MIHSRVITILTAAGLSAVLCRTAHAQAISYQGHLLDSGAPANGAYDVRFKLFDAGTGSNQLGSVLTNSPVAVSNGLFSVMLDFGSNVFTGATNWIEIDVRPAGATNNYTSLSPRQPVTPAPWALFASSANAAGIQGVVADDRLSTNIPRLNGDAVFTGTVTLTNPANVLGGDGSRLSNLIASDITQGVLSADVLNGDMPSPPITYGVWSSPPYGTNTMYFPWSSPSVSNVLCQYYGGPNPNHGGYLEQENSYEREPYFVEWTTDSTNVIFGIADDNASWRLFIDDVREQLHPYGFFNGGNNSWVEYGFAQRKTRHLRLEGDFRLIGFMCHTNEALLPTARRQKTAIIIADSWCESYPCWGNWLPRQFPNVEFWISGIGATGYTNAPPPKLNYNGRIQQDLIQYHPDYAIIWGSFNDTSDAINPATSAPFSSNDIYSAAVNLYRTIQTQSPQTQIVVIGPQENKTPLAGTWIATRAAIVAAANTCGVTAFIDPQNGPWITGSYTPGSAWGNASVYIGANAHPTPAGADYLGEIIAQNLSSVAPSLSQPKAQPAQFVPLSSTIAPPLAAQLGMNGAALWVSNGNVYVSQSPNGVAIVNTLLIAAAALPSPPGAPNISLIPGNLQITVSWSGISGAGSYQVQRALASTGPFSLIANTISNSYIDGGLLGGTNYFYMVSALGTNGVQGPNSTVVSAVPNNFDPASAPGLMLRYEADQFNALAPTNGQPIIEWTNTAFPDPSFNFVRYQTQGVPFWTNNPSQNNGEPWLMFPQPDGTLILNKNGSIPEPCTVFIFTQFGATRGPVFYGSSFPKHQLSANPTANLFSLGDDQYGNQGATYVNSWLLHETTFDTTNSSWYTNGVAVRVVMNADPGPLDSGSFLLSFGGYQSSAQIAALLIYTNSVAVPDRVSIRNWFRSKYHAY